MGQTQGVMFAREEGGVNGSAPPLPVHVGEHLAYGEVVQRGRGLDPDLDQQLDQKSPVIGEILFNLQWFKNEDILFNFIKNLLSPLVLGLRQSRMAS